MGLLFREHPKAQPGGRFLLLFLEPGIACDPWFTRPVT